MTLNPIKTVVVAIIILAFVAVIYIIWPAPKIESIKIMTLENISDVNIKSELKNIISYIKLAPEDITLYRLVKITGKENQLKATKPPSFFGKSKTKFLSNISNTLIRITTENLTNNIFSVEETNRRLELLFEDISKNQDVDKTAYILIGAFHECFDSLEAKKSIKLIAESLKSITDEVTIYWLSFDPTSGDKFLKSYLSKKYKNIKIIDKSVNVTNPRICGVNPSPLTNFFFDLIAFSSFKDDDCINEIIKIANSELMKLAISVNYISKNGSVVTNFEAKDSAKLAYQIREFLQNAPESDVKSSRFMISQFVNKYSDPDNKYSGQVFLLGTLPFSKQKFVNIKPLQNKTNLKINIEIESSKPEIDAKQVFINAFSSINVQINSFCRGSK